MKKELLALALLLLAASIAVHAQDTKATLNAAAQALGATNLNSIQYLGSGTNNAFGQAYAPGGPWPAFKVTSYTASINYANPAMRVELERTNPDGVIRGGGGLPLLAPQKQIQVVSGRFAWNVAGQNATPAPAAVADRLRAIWITPYGVIKAAQQAGTDTTAKSEGGGTVITFPAEGIEVRATLDAANLVTRVQTRSDNPVLGDMVTETIYLDYRDFSGVKFPTQILQTQGGFPVLTLAITDVRTNVEVAYDVPQNVRNAPPAAPEPVVVREMAPGVIHISGGALHSSAVEFKDYIVLFDAPNNDDRAHDVFEAARKAFPGKPIKYVVNTHHHFDHLGGLRYDISEEAIIITQEQEEPFYERLLTLPHTIKPDRLALAPRKAVFETVGDSRTMTDGTRTMEIYRMQGFSHVDTMLFAYLPKEKILIEPDAYNPPPPDAPPPPSVSPLFLCLYDNIQRLNLDVDVILPFHGRIVTMNDLRAAVGKSAGD